MKRRVSIIFVYIFLFLFLPLSLYSAEAVDLDELLKESPDSIYLVVGEVTPVKVEGLTRVSVVDPEVADVVEAEEEAVSVIGKAIGQTPLFIWDNKGKRMVMLYVSNDPLDLLKDRIKTIFKKVGIHEIDVTANEKEGKVMLTGEIPQNKVLLYEKVVENFYNDVLDFTQEEESEDMVRIDMQITEVEESAERILGVEWNTQQITYTETLPDFDGSVGDFFKIGKMRRTTPTLQATLNALVTEGKARVLSKPNLVVLSGDEASFLVGGEIPIRTTTTMQTGATQEDVEFKEYGIGLTMTPTVREGKVDLLMNVEVSDVDNTIVTPTGDLAFLTRTATTRLYLDSGQTIVLAGLIKHTESRNVEKVPYLSNLPIFGLLFRKKDEPWKDTETIITLSPTIIRDKKEKKEDKRSAKEIYAERMKEPYTPLPYYTGIPKEMTGYVQELQRTISMGVNYPEIARRNGWQGTVHVGVMLLNDGTLAFAFVKTSSGYEMIDEDAVKTVQELAPYPSFPQGVELKELSLTIPIVYSLD